MRSGLPPAMIELARRLVFGDGLQRDQVSACSWLLRADWRGAKIDDTLQCAGERLSAKEKEHAVEIALAPYL